MNWLQVCISRGRLRPKLLIMMSHRELTGQLYQSYVRVCIIKNVSKKRMRGLVYLHVMNVQPRARPGITNRKERWFLNLANK